MSTMDLQEDRCYATGDQLAPTFIFASPNQYHTGMATWIAQQPPEKQTQIDLLTPHYGLRRQPVTGNQPASGRLGLNKLLNWCRQLHAHRALTVRIWAGFKESARL
ncbi:hypothetical protein PGT21_031705 [Puccinia graminis f. sp. tritici]|uniref:Uncharacterized protein n=1 Tax=Puccinia graminis f. sp. tritici TaxID=56615 RepID=A0A5B0R2L0_PUCGR|nr:hypothetical protein PGT21_031705 [Puccinia graminis f. sp. tritici]